MRGFFSNGLSSNWRGWIGSPWAVLGIWALYCALRLALIPLTGSEPVGPDDWMRLFQLRDWLAGQSWWDTTQYRVNPPEGYSMHWSRLVDLPLAALIPVFGETVSMALVPLVWLLPALFALRAIMLRLGLSDLAILFGLVALPLFPMLPGVFAPFAIDHHGPQAVLGLACAALLLHDSRRSALLCGVLAAAWLVISLEGLPLVAVIAGLYGLRYALGERSVLGWFLVSLTLASGLLLVATRPASELAGLYCDILLPGHVAVFAVAALIAAALPLVPWQNDMRARLAGLLLIPVVCLPLAGWLLGACATNPMAELDPVLQRWWHGYITEGLPVWRQPVSVAMMLFWSLGIVLAGAWLAHRQGLWHRAQALRWALLTLFALAAGGYSLLVMREGVIAQLLAIPFGALLLAHMLPRARALRSTLPRVGATLGAVALATPMFVSALAKSLDPLFPTATMRQNAAAPVTRERCDLSRLAALEPGLVLTTMDEGPELLGKTRHTIVAASYHRNQRPMRDSIRIFTGSPAKAEPIVRLYDPDYLVACTSAGDLALYRTAAPGNLADALANDKAPDWLTPAEGFEEGGLKAWRVRPGGSPSPRR